MAGEVRILLGHVPGGARKSCLRPRAGKGRICPSSGFAFCNTGLIGETAIDGFVARFGTEIVACCTPKDDRNVSRVLGGEYHRDELRVVGFRIIKLLGQYCPLPFHPQAFSGLFLAPESTLIGLGAHHENEVGFLKLVDCPSRPSFGRGLLVLVDVAIDLFGAQAVG